MIRTTTERRSARAGDEALLRRCRAGDEESWSAIVARYRRLIFSVPTTAYGMSDADAQEIFQRVVVKLYEHVGRLRRRGSLAAWLVTVARNECRRHRRTQGRWASVESLGDALLREDPPDVVGALADVECEHRLARAFGRLDEPSRELLAALYVESPRPAYSEIAARIGRPVGALGPTRARALEKLRRLYLSDRGASTEVGCRVDPRPVGHSSVNLLARSAV